ncbi:PLP-dependent transferase [Teratosphaeria nubilosa]|uniref:PLP-dependent transferase n=1 Tax=Teratosphaeria nubilosa TaxID=161662 RepID=A0A6G1LHN2_9PEZI|nr:PLP-dependent transferase [Teratosphaeria nubilosa]
MEASAQYLAALSSHPPLEAFPRRGSSITSAQHSPNTARFPITKSAQSSLENLSSTSFDGNGLDYQTDETTPPSSDSYPDDVESDDVEDFRDREYPQLKGKVYLDHGGATLYSKSLVEEFSADLIANLYGNPHSASSPSALAGHRVDAVRERALRFFGADPAEFDLVFVANATAAIKLVIDCFKDHAAASNTPVWYGYHRDAHTSLVGVREATKMHRCFTSDEEVDVWINSGGLGGPRARQLGLFAYPGQSNMTGRRLPLSWPGRIRKAMHKAATYTLLDAAALASTAPLDLSDSATAPDFVALSFYKIFGFPDIGALIVRKESAHVLEDRKYFGGGTVEMIISINDVWHAKKETSLHDRLEDGTLPFHSIFALDHAMNVHERLYGQYGQHPMKFISQHTAQLGKQLYEGLSGLRHANGLPVCRIYKDENAVYGDPSVQGATIAFNVQKADGTMVGFEDVEQAADDRNIYVRSGSLCNPGGVATYLNWSPAEMKAAFAAGHRCSHPIQTMLGKATGVVRVSLGAMSTSSDVQTFVRFVDDVYAGRANQARTSKSAHASTHLGVSLPLSPPASPIPNGKPIALDIPHALFVPASISTPSTIGTGISAEAPWGEHTALSGSQAAGTDKPRYPPFVPSDYRRKPWEEQLRAQALANTGPEMRNGEIEGGSVTSHQQANPTPSIKARKFGRSVVNLLRTKSHINEVRYEEPPLPIWRPFGQPHPHEPQWPNG